MRVLLIAGGGGGGGAVAALGQFAVGGGGVLDTDIPVAGNLTVTVGAGGAGGSAAGGAGANGGESNPLPPVLLSWGQLLGEHMASVIDVEKITIRADERGLTISGSVTLPNGQVIPVSIPRAYTEWDDLLREARNAGKLAEGIWKRIWRKIRG